MTPNPEDMTGDDLTGSPELFASNLLIVRAIEHDMQAVTIRREKDGITVTNHHDEREYETETMTDDVTIWDKLIDRFHSMTEGDNPESGGILKPSTPATEKVESMTVEYPNDDTIELSFQYPD